MASKRLAALLAAGSLFAGPCASAPFVIGTNHAAAGSATLTITVTAACPAGSAPGVATGQFGSASGGIPTITDSKGNAYGSNGSSVNGSTSKITMFTAPAAGYTPLAVGDTIPIVYGLSTVEQEAVAVCIPGVRYYSRAGATGAGASGSSNAPAISSVTSATPNNLAFVVTGVSSGGADTWTTSSGFTVLGSALGTSALRLDYQLSPSLTTGSYSATNGTLRAWVTNIQTFNPQICSLASAGAGSC